MFYIRFLHFSFRFGIGIMGDEPLRRQRCLTYLYLRFSSDHAPKAPNASVPNIEEGSGTGLSETLSTNKPESPLVSVTFQLPHPTYVEGGDCI